MGKSNNKIEILLDPPTYSLKPMQRDKSKTKGRGRGNKNEGSVSYRNDKYMLCLGGFLLVALCLAGWGIVLASQLETREPLIKLSQDNYYLP